MHPSPTPSSCSGTGDPARSRRPRNRDSGAGGQFRCTGRADGEERGEPGGQTLGKGGRDRSRCPGGGLEPVPVSRGGSGLVPVPGWVSAASCAPPSRDPAGCCPQVRLLPAGDPRWGHGQFGECREGTEHSGWDTPPGAPGAAAASQLPALHPAGVPSPLHPGEAAGGLRALPGAAQHSQHLLVPQR